jgi:hypothetical protein
MAERKKWSISEVRTVEGETMIVGGESYEFGLIAAVTNEADARQIIADRESYDELVKALEAGRPAIENLSTCQEQCDFDGIMVKVSRQAVEETLDVIRAFKATLASSLSEQDRGTP